MASSRALLLFDGVCNFCNEAVLFVIDRDPRERFVFASLQSALGQRLLRERGLGPEIRTLVLIDGAHTFVRSEAALRVALRLRFPWPLAYVFKLVPRALRDALYDAFAARRYRLFGESATCRVPSPELARRFVA